MQAYVKHVGAYMPWESMYDDAAGERLREWIRANVSKGDLQRRAVIAHQKGDGVGGHPKILADLARNAPLHSGRSRGSANHGLVIAAWPREPELQLCISRAHDNTLILFQWGDSPSFAGWATAVGAFNAATGEPTPHLDSELDEEFRCMLMYDREIREGAKMGPQRQIPQSSMSIFKEAGLDEDFVVTYCLGLGYRGDHQQIRYHYREARP